MLILAVNLSVWLLTFPSRSLVSKKRLMCTLYCGVPALRAFFQVKTETAATESDLSSAAMSGGIPCALQMASLFSALPRARFCSAPIAASTTEASSSGCPSVAAEAAAARAAGFRRTRAPGPCPPAPSRRSAPSARPLQLSCADRWSWRSISASQPPRPPWLAGPRGRRARW